MADNHGNLNSDKQKLKSEVFRSFMDDKIFKYFSQSSSAQQTLKKWVKLQPKDDG